MAAYAALVSLMNNIQQIQRHTRLPISFDQKQSESLLEKVNFLIDFLESYSSHAACEEMKDLESRISDAAYVAEDIIETHVVDRIDSLSRVEKGENELMDHLTTTAQTEKNPSLSYLPYIEKVMEEMDLIKEEVMKIRDGLQTTSTIIDLSSSSIHVGENVNVMVGFDHELIELMGRLTQEGSASRQIIPIVGMGGIGKTTLAKTAYEKPLIVHYFDFRAWVSISQEYSLRQILLGLLGKEYSQMSEVQLGDTLYKSLCGRRYLVVLDDLWNVEAWEMVKVFFPEYKNGSKIIVTTRISSLAPYFGWCNLKVNFLNEEKGWNLFCGKVFGQEGCPHELEEVGRKIVNNCQGLPLSIVVIGGLLAKSPRTKEYWEYIERDTKTIVSLEGDEMCMKILYLSYNHLPVHLKPCFLYMRNFPEDKIISVSLLINLWVAEGFLKPNNSKELEAIATEYLIDLISRNLILVYAHGPSGKIKSCMIHDLLRNLCLYISNMHRSMGSQRWKLKFFCRSLMYPYSTTSVPKCSRLLRVLIGCDENSYGLPRYLLADTFKLFNSRLIVLRTIQHSYFPSSVFLLWNLQILIVKGVDKGPIAPLEIWEMTELRHLQFTWNLYLPDPPSLQIDKRGDSVMKKLHTLKRIADFKFNEEVVKRIPNIKKMNISYGPICTGKELDEQGLKNLHLLDNLVSLTLSFLLQTGSDLLSCLTFPNSLKKLSLTGCGFHWEDMPIIGSLPHLEVLKLNLYAFIGRKWVLAEEGFRCLKYLKIMGCYDLVHWIAEDTHFPCLENLQLNALHKLVEIPSSIGDIPTLQNIELHHCSNSAVISAKKILEDQENLGNVGLQVRVVCKDTDLESLASVRFRVEVRNFTWCNFYGPSAVSSAKKY